MPAKTYKSHKEKQNTWHNTPQSTSGVFGHKIEIAGIIQVQPDKHEKAGQRHHGNQAGQRRQLAPYLRAESNNAHTNQQLDNKSHIDRYPPHRDQSIESPPQAQSNLIFSTGFHPGFFT
jgi:hypothetical protein